jgi:hypothetical protein
MIDYSDIKMTIVQFEGNSSLAAVSTETERSEVSCVLFRVILRYFDKYFYDAAYSLP